MLREAHHTGGTMLTTIAGGQGLLLSTDVVPVQGMMILVEGGQAEQGPLASLTQV